jgi:outer membrane receptor protein involved in Fe transport
MKSLLQNTRILFLFSAVFSASSYADKDIQEIIVTSDFREGLLKNIPTSISVIDAEVISQRNSNHLEQILALAPNVNFSAGASRGRYFQIRGIGERSQFVDPLNPSVGTYVDGIDFTGFGGAATLLDIDQVEVLRGSQGTRFGANALAGVINLKTADPSAESQGYAKTSLSSYGGRSLETAFGGALNDQWHYRVAAGKTLFDGFINNITLDRKDTNNIDELTSRLKLRYLAADNLTIDFTALHLDIDNGFDTFSLDENRDTLSDEPGNDRQDTTAFAVNSNWTVSDALSINSIFTTNRSDVEYSFDEDWAYLDLWLNNMDGEGAEEYQGFDSYQRDVSRDSGEVRWLSGPSGKILNSDWLVGFYRQISTIRLLRSYVGIYRGYFDDVDPTEYVNWDTPNELFNSEYNTASTSVFAQAKTPLKDNLNLTSGLRYESWKSEYSDSNAIAGKNSENLLGGKLALELNTDAENLLFAGLTRGYKAGGFNSEEKLPSEQYRQFDTEYQWNYEVGAKLYSPSGTLSNSITAFYADRKDLQLKSSTYDENQNKWIEFVTNAGTGYSYGVEWEVTWQPQDNLRIASSLGLLKTKITEHDNDDPNAFNLKDREVAHAPEYSFATSVQYGLTEKLTAILEVEGKDKFYYSDSHNFQSQAYNLVNVRLAYQANGYQLTAYINNATDKDYGVRGFSGWDNDPRSGEGFDEQSYQQLGAPKVIGLSVRADF